MKAGGKDWVLNKSYHCIYEKDPFLCILGSICPASIPFQDFPNNDNLGNFKLILQYGQVIQEGKMGRNKWAFESEKDFPRHFCL